MLSKGPRVVFERGGRVIAKQAPLVGDCCVGRVCKPQWCSIEAVCPRCKGAFCRIHFGDHLRRFELPRDSWRTVRKRFLSLRAKHRLEHGAEAFEAMPVALGSWCKTPTGPRATAPCGYESDKCRGTERGCPRCRFTFCEVHLPRHVVRLWMPRRLLLTLLDAYRRQLDEVAQRRRPYVRVRVPPPSEWA